jgi:hypothetical protein
MNSQPCKGINLTTRHTRARRAPRVATLQRDNQDPPHPSVRLPHVCLDGHTVGGPCTIPLGMVG